MSKELIAWKELLAFEEFDDVTDEYGPHTQAVVNGFETLDTISWFSAAGSEPPPGTDVEGVNTWGDALGHLTSSDQYGPHGHPVGPMEALEDVRDADEIQDWLDAAFAAVEEFVDYENYIPSYLEKPDRLFLREHLREFVEGLLIEIVAADMTDCTYFRECLSWFEAGHFPCGWDGEWPDGRLRVF